MNSALPPQEDKKQPKVTRFWRVNGIGTIVLGKRDFRADGTHLTTAWITLLWVPVIPLESYRVLPDEGSSFRIRDVLPVNKKQVLFTYAFAATYIFLVVLALLGLDKNDSFGALFFCLFAVALIPFGMRRYARRKLGLPKEYLFGDGW